MISIVDYGLGNIFAFANIIKNFNIEFNIARTSTDLDKADKIILPGVGSFDWAMEKLDKSGMRKKLDELVLNKKKPVLGVCVGMQIMFERSEEGTLKGLSWIRGNVEKFTNNENNLSVPHIGWNNVNIKKNDDLCEGLNNPHFYFLHSYYVNPQLAECVQGTTNYGIDFPSIIKNKNILGTQFHPEKSHSWGLNLINNFVKM